VGIAVGANAVATGILSAATFVTLVVLFEPSPFPDAEEDEDCV
jgi:hypothetical protein